MNILVTGGAGYLGSVLVGELLAARHTVTVLDNFMYSQVGLGPLCCNPNLTLVWGDAADPHMFKPLVRKADVIIPLAAIVGALACARDAQRARVVNYEALLDLKSSLSHTQWVLFPNTNSGYGRGGEGECTEESPLTPVSTYGKLKVKAEERIRSFPNSVVFRFATLFGCSPRMRLDLMVNDFCYRAVCDLAMVLFDADYRRNFLHVRDAAQVFLFALEHFDAMRGQVYNAGLSDANLTKRELCAAIKTHVPEFVWVESLYSSDPDKRDYVVSNAKLEALGWRAQRSLADGIAELIRAFSALPYATHCNAP